MCSIYWVVFSLSWNGAYIVPQSVMESVKNSWCSFCWDCVYSGHCKFLVRDEWMPTSKKKFLIEMSASREMLFQSYSISTAVPTCYRPRARNMRDRKNYTHHTIIMKKESSLCGPMPFPEHNACVSSVPLCYSQLLVHHFLHISSLISGSFLSWIEFLLIFYVFTMTFLHIVSPIS